MIVILDTNIVASATFWRGKPAYCLEAWALGRFDLAVTHAILSEYAEVVARLSDRYPGRPANDWLSAIERAGHLFLPVPVDFRCSDPDDQMFLECAAAAKASCLVTGDKGHLLKYKENAGTAIISASEFLLSLGVPENPA